MSLSPVVRIQPPPRNGDNGGGNPPPVQPTPPQQPVSGSCDSRREDRTPVVNQPWQPSDGWRIVNFWSNQPGVNQQERKLLLAPNERPALLGGGAVWIWPDNCGNTVQAEYGKNGLPAVSLAQLRADGLVR